MKDIADAKNRRL